MKKLTIVIAAAAAMGALSLGPALAEDVTVEGVGYVRVDPNGEITADGEDSNGTYAGGYITARRSSQNVCADDTGSPEESPSPTCVP